MTSSSEVAAVAARAASRAIFASNIVDSALARAVYLNSIAAYASSICFGITESATLSLANKVSTNLLAALPFLLICI